jgi:hypothetical protein
LPCGPNAPSRHHGNSQPPAMFALYLGNVTRSTYRELQVLPLKNNHKTFGSPR